MDRLRNALSSVAQGLQYIFDKPFYWISDGTRRIDNYVNKSTFGRVFHLSGSGHVGSFHLAWSISVQ